MSLDSNFVLWKKNQTLEARITELEAQVAALTPKPKVIVERWFNININRSGKPQIIEYYSESDARLGEPSIHEMRIATAIPFKWTEGDQV